MKKKSIIESYASEYAMSAGDNAVTRRQMNDSIIAPEFANEGTFAQALQQDAMEEAPPKE